MNLTIEQMIEKIVDSRLEQKMNEFRLEFTNKYDKTLDVIETADYLGISTQTLYKMCTEKLIPHMRLGVNGSKRPKIKFKLSELETWRQSQIEVVR